MEFEPIAAIATQQRAHMPREFDLIGLGNSLVDILFEITEDEFAPLGFEKGTMRLVDPPEQKTLLGGFRDHEPHWGSVTSQSKRNDRFQVVIECCIANR